MMQFLVEAVILTMTGGLLGFLGGAGLAHLLAPLLSNTIGGGGIHIHAHISLNAFFVGVWNVGSCWFDFWNLTGTPSG